MSEVLDDVTELHYTTRVKTETIRFKWEIPDFVFEVEDAMARARFHQTMLLEGKNSSHWWLSMSQKKYSNDKFAIVISCTISQPCGQYAILEVRAAKEPDEDRKYNDDKQIGSKSPTGFRLNTKVEITEIKNPPLFNGKLILIGKLIIYQKYGDFLSSSVPNNFERLSNAKLVKDMGQLLQQNQPGDATFSDIEIHTDDGTVIPAHRNILASRCEYFKTMLTSGMAEVKTGKILVEGINGKAMKVLLHFLYTGCLQNNWNNSEVLHDFIKVAHCYQVTSLVKFLNENVGKVCDGQSAENLLMLCKTLEMKTAEKQLRRLIINRLNDSCGDPECDELLLKIAKKQSEMS